MPHLQLLVAFGGYNGKYHNTVSVYKLPTSEYQEPEAKAAAAAAGDLASSAEQAGDAATAASKGQQQEPSGSPSKANGAKQNGPDTAARQHQQQQQQLEPEPRGGLEVSWEGQECVRSKPLEFPCHGAVVWLIRVGYCPAVMLWLPAKMTRFWFYAPTCCGCFGQVSRVCCARDSFESYSTF